MRNYIEYLTIPHTHLERDCYALVKLFYRNELGVCLPDVSYEEDWADAGQDLIAEGYSGAGFAKTAPLDFTYGNVLAFGGDGKTPRHLGISLGDGTFLHTTKRGTARHSYKKSVWGALLVATFKYEGTPDDN